MSDPIKVGAAVPQRVLIDGHLHPLWLSFWPSYYKLENALCTLCKKKPDEDLAFFCCVTCESPSFVHFACAPDLPKECKEFTPDRSNFVERAVQYRKFFLPDNCRDKPQAYRKEFAARSETAVKALSEFSTFPAGICAIIVAYQETHVLLVENPQEHVPLKIRFEGTSHAVSINAVDYSVRQVTVADGLVELEKLLGLSQHTIELFAVNEPPGKVSSIMLKPSSPSEAKGGKADKVTAGARRMEPNELLTRGRRLMMKGRPYLDADGGCVESDVLTAGPDSCGETKQKRSPSLQEDAGDAAQPASQGSWSGSLPGFASGPRLQDLTSDQRARLAAQWAADGAAEHASIASFARVTLQLMALGAPAGLLADTQRGAADEVRHARLCFALAAAYAGKAVEPGKFPLQSPMQLETSLSGVAAATAAEGCVEETLSCLLMAEAVDRCEDPCIRAVLSSIVKDEARHAALAWRTVQWCLSVDSKQDSAAAVAAVFERAAQTELAAAKSLAAAAGDDQDLEAFGRLSSPTELALRASLFARVVRPLSRQLLAAGTASLSVAKAMSMDEDRLGGVMGALERALSL